MDTSASLMGGGGVQNRIIVTSNIRLIRAQ